MPEIAIDENGLELLGQCDVRAARSLLEMPLEVNSFSGQIAENFRFKRRIPGLDARHDLASFLLCENVRHPFLFS